MTLNVEQIDDCVPTYLNHKGWRKTIWVKFSTSPVLAQINF